MKCLKLNSHLSIVLVQSQLKRVLLVGNHEDILSDHPFTTHVWASIPYPIIRTHDPFKRSFLITKFFETEEGINAVSLIGYFLMAFIVIT